MKKRIWRIVISAVLLGVGLLLELWKYNYTLFIFLPAYFLAGYDVLIKAAKHMKSSQLLDENFLMTVATIGALIIGEYAEAVAIVVFYQVGELFGDIAESRSETSIRALMDLRPDTVSLVTDEGIVKVSPDEVKAGSVISVEPGERIALDGVIISGASSVDVSAVKGEAIPENLGEGDEITGGSVAVDGSLKIKVTADYKDSTVAKIISMAALAAEKKSKQENFVSRFAAVYTPVVVTSAVILMFLPTLLGFSFTDWFHRGLMFLVVSCPCALVVSVPLSFFCGMGGASKLGVLVKGSSALEKLAKISAVCFDKTGTLTDGKFTVTEVNAVGTDKDTLLKIAAAAESPSPHPIARSISRAADITGFSVTDHKNFAGKGICSTVNGREYYLGTAAWLRELNINVPETEGVHIASGGEYLGSITIADTVKSEAAEALKKLKKLGVSKFALLSGADEKSVNETARQLLIDNCKSGLLPEDKLGELEKLQAENNGGLLAYVGDGINDVPVLARADVGISMGIAGSDAALGAADAVIMNDELSRLPSVIRHARKTVANAKTNVIFAISVKIAIMILSALGITGMWLAVLADVGVCIIAVLNSTRTLFPKKRV